MLENLITQKADETKHCRDINKKFMIKSTSEERFLYESLEKDCKTQQTLWKVNKRSKNVRKPNSRCCFYMFDEIFSCLKINARLSISMPEITRIPLHVRHRSWKMIFFFMLHRVHTIAMRFFLWMKNCLLIRVKGKSINSDVGWSYQMEDRNSTFIKNRRREI